MSQSQAKSPPKGPPACVLLSDPQRPGQCLECTLKRSYNQSNTANTDDTEVGSPIRGSQDRFEYMSFTEGMLLRRNRKDGGKQERNE